jgi:hypothetical protein
LSLEADWQANRYLQLEGFFYLFPGRSFPERNGAGKKSGLSLLADHLQILILPLAEAPLRRKITTWYKIWIS